MRHVINIQTGKYEFKILTKQRVHTLGKLLMLN